MASIAYWTERVRLIGLSLGTAAKKGDTKAVGKWAARLADASTSLAVAVNPPNAEDEAEIAVAVDPSTLSIAEARALFGTELAKALAAKGRSAEAGQALSATEMLDIARSLGIERQIVATGVWGSPADGFPGLDWSLFTDVAYTGTEWVAYLNGQVVGRQPGGPNWNGMTEWAASLGVTTFG